MSKTNPLVSVIIPTFNCGQYIVSAIRSVCEQTYTNIEVIVIDDGSTDDTSKTIAKLTDSRVRYIYTKNTGNYFARNRGLEEAKGDFIAFLDADDIWVKNKLERQIKEFEENPKLGLCCSNFLVRDVESQKTYTAPNWSYDNSFDSEGPFIERAIKHNFMLTSTLVIKRECVNSLGFFSTKFQNAMDYEYCLRIALQYFCLYLSDRLVIRLEHPANISKNKINTGLSLLYIFSEFFDKFRNSKYYKPSDEVLLKKRMQKIRYELGLAYLVAKKYSDAEKTFEELEMDSKLFFTKIAQFSAHYHISWLADIIKNYQNFKIKQSLKKSTI